MKAQLPDAIRECVVKAAKRLGNGLDFLDWPSGDKNAPCSELNGLLNFHYCLANQEPPFHFYSEGTIATRGRVDLVACNGPIALAIEAKSLGPINARAKDILKDLDRLRSYVPAYSKPDSAFEPTDWWARAEQRWGLVLITSFRGQEIRNAWESESIDEAYAMLQSYPSSADRPADMDSGMMQLLAQPDMVRFSGRITHNARWGNDNAGWLLCGAVPLDATPAPSIAA